MKYIVDRIEGTFAVVEDEEENITNIPISMIKGNVTEKSVLEKAKNGYIVLEKETIDRKKYIENLAKDMWKN